MNNILKSVKIINTPVYNYGYVVGLQVCAFTTTKGFNGNVHVGLKVT